jgi:uncharacterized protein (DUF1501 family)
MLTLFGRRHPFCDRMTRRDVLRVGTLGATGLGLADLLRLRAVAGKGQRPKAVIMLCLPGGPSHLDMYDMKPAAASEVRGEFSPIATNAPGIEVCHLMPRQATIADKLAVVRNLQFTQPDHQLHEMYTGFPTLARRPAFGSIVSRLRRPGLLPSYISLGLSDHPRTVAKAEIPTYAGLAHRPFEPSAQGLSNLELSAQLDDTRLADRQGLLHRFDRLRRALDSHGDMASLDRFNAQALAMVTSPQVRRAFDIESEPAAVRERYGSDVRFTHNYQFGHTWHGPKLLLARRLVEAGVPVVTLAMGGWDHHGNVNGVRGTIFERFGEQLPLYDRSIHALVSDLHERGLEHDVAVVVWGEFGRTPRVNKNGGRDHWPSAGFALFAGGGFRTGQLIGRTDAQGARPEGKPYGPQNVLATIYHVLGIDPAATIPDFSGRPMSLLDDREPIHELLA